MLVMYHFILIWIHSYQVNCFSNSSWLVFHWFEQITWPIWREDKKKISPRLNIVYFLLLSWKDVYVSIWILWEDKRIIIMSLCNDIDWDRMQMNGVQNMFVKLLTTNFVIVFCKNKKSKRKRQKQQMMSSCAWTNSLMTQIKIRNVYYTFYV